MQGNATRSVAPVCELELIAHSAGHGTSTAFSVNVFVDSDTGTPSFTSANAALRLAAVIRLSVPSSSSLPQRPQFDNSFCQASNCASLTSGRDGDPCEAASPTKAPAMPKEQTRTETALENVSARMMFPPVVVRFAMTLQDGSFGSKTSRPRSAFGDAFRTDARRGSLVTELPTQPVSKVFH